MKSIEIPETITSIGKWTFANTENLVYVKLPDKLTSMGSYTFYCTIMTSITLPSLITTVHDSTFEGSTSLTTIPLLGNVDTIKSNGFKNLPKLRIINYYGKTNPTYSSICFTDTININQSEINNKTKFHILNHLMIRIMICRKKIILLKNCNFIHINKKLFSK